MANFTRKAIMETFTELLEDRPLSEITIKDIVETCGINRNTFYYHFQDMPALIEEIVKEEAEAIIRKYPSINSIVECFDALTEFASNKKRPIMHIYHSLNRETFERNLMWVSESFVKSYVETALSGNDIAGNHKDVIINYYKCLGFGLIIDWLNNNMSEEHVKEVRQIFLLKKDFAAEIAAALHSQI